MLSFKSLVVFALLTGIFAQECSVGDLGVEDFSDTVTVTNASAVAEAFVVVKFNHGQVAMMVPPGKSRPATGLAATKYTATVTDPGSNTHGTYRDRLLALRSELLDLSLSVGASDSVVVAVWTELSVVQAALDQMTSSAKVQSCGGNIETGVESHVTLEWHSSLDGESLWVLDCG